MLNQITPILHSNHHSGCIQSLVLTAMLTEIKTPPDFEHTRIKRTKYGLNPLYFNGLAHSSKSFSTTKLKSRADVKYKKLHRNAPYERLICQYNSGLATSDNLKHS